MQLTFDDTSVLSSARLADIPDQSNPCARFAKDVTTLDDGYDAMECIPSERLGERGIGVTDFQIPTFEHARFAVELFASAIESAAERNLNSEEFRRKTVSAAMYINHATDRHGHALEGAPITIDNAGPRGHVVVIPAGMSQQAFRKSVQRIIGKDRELIEIAVPQGGMIRYTRLPSLTVPFPENGAPRSFGKLFLRYFDDAMNLAHSARLRGPFHRGEEEIGPALQAYAIAANLGVLIVEQIDMRNASTKLAKSMWAILARFTADTGIPVVCLATPGAAAALSEQSTAAALLAGKTWYNIASAQRDSAQWSLTCEYLYSTHLTGCMGFAEPEWFADTMWWATCGLSELAVRVCIHIESVSRKEDFERPGKDEFLRFARDALVLEWPHLRAIRRLREGGSFTPASMRRHGDWLAVEPMMQSVPGLEEMNPAFRIADVPTPGANHA
ncbi:TPA: hypothetical protein QDB08_002683 [Burkholderia vietnamiensis]|uniref:hypothetical protein n=1 Tax=Burkholderia vietnamiensis TaxID=60552 RepID=UPI001594A48D|nr:hypothetical protein [Burkholderia vietnamiensis]HDR9009713.1 hypothetical protein [Burkholderia vietnamiensis]HDR9013758.1 hypothetical protein [Burkholderia vietnamiensis]